MKTLFDFLKLAIWLALVTMTVACSATETPEPKATVQSVLTEVRQARHLIAMGGVVVQSGLISTGVTGNTRQVGGEALQADAYFHIGSCAKAMTALLVATYVDEGRLSWDDSLGNLLGGSVAVIHPSFRAVTLRQLLSHRGGAPIDTTDEILIDPGLTATTLRGQRLEYTARALSEAPVTPVGSFSYSNGGYLIVSCVLEALTDSSFEALMQARVAAPLGLEIGWGWPSEKGIGNPWGYGEEHGSLVEVPPGSALREHPAFAAAGNLYLRLSSYGKFLRDQLNGIKGRPALCRSAQYVEMHTPTEGDYALGWVRVTTPAGFFSTHAGNITAYAAEVIILPAEDLAIAVMVNQGNGVATVATAEGINALFLSIKKP